MKPPLFQKQIQTQLLRWYKKNKRDLPWRKTRNPYAIWVSEILLQQTQVSTVIPYYRKFLKTFPTIRSLARADLSQVLKVWEGLGYYSRARNLHRAAQTILNHFNGKIPDNLQDLLSLPGVGRYTAGAILSIAFNQEVPILDGNVKRVLSRFFAVAEPLPKSEKSLWKYSEALIPKGRASSFNQALMDLGSMICIPKTALCSECPIKKLCRGYQSGEPERFTTRVMKKRIPHIESIAAVIQKNGKVLLRQRAPKGLLGGLWEFPNWKIGKRERVRLRLRNAIEKDLGIKARVGELFGVFNQTYSHFKLSLHVFHGQPLNGVGTAEWVSIKHLNQFAMSRIDRRIADALSRGR